MTAAIIALLAVLSGFAHYKYEAKDCKLEITSLRIMGAGQISIDKNCQVNAGSKDMERAK